MSPTLRDVAERAGVSIRTVSNVVNGFAHVAPATRARVEQVVAELGYRPNTVARSLRQGRSRMLALVVPELDVPYFAELTRFVIEHAAARGYTVVVDQTDGDPTRERELIMNGTTANLFDGVIFSPIALGGADLRDRTVTTPVVLLGERASAVGLDHVMIDNVTAAGLATRHLIELGRTRIAAIGDQNDETRQTARLRTLGFRQAVTEAGLRVDPVLLRSTSFFHRADGAAAMAELLALADPPDAVFCYNDLLALGALRTALQHGVRVPEDIAIIGFDDIEDGRYSTPSLSTISPDKEQIARLAVELLANRLDGDTTEPVEVPADFTLQARESTLGR
ncbi:MAG: LacI family DNA-binding transcriptional regulator [Hamadaea sp.]|uniref:LacI family DNA-binding transcriptional regulator n=1 Tax=Hamadaea sp. TaxID=2024425 RepID=UPI0018110411|nr:LacI family DNA-binding transcriptional regulator [Hamadaea sp.]NUR73865.1 LacI family DNA-binding transcriptional regulator [Hamadaea sp.]NUT18970.1 LacI family DNA-binding transcriptional regulator [Hamadaea sp.]